MYFQSKNICFFLLLLLLFFLSYARDTLFIIINAQIAHEGHNYANTSIPECIKQIASPDLKNLKWLIAACFFILFMSISTGAIYYYFKNYFYAQLALIIYLALGFCSVIFELLMHQMVFSFQVRNILHIPETIIQSPIVLLVLFSALLFFKKL